MTSTAKAEKASVSDREMIITRQIKAPRDLVWEAWTDDKHLAKWWGPNGFSTTTSAFTFKPGGVWQFMMHGPDGTDYPNRIEYSEIKRPALLKYRHVGDSGKEFFSSTVTFEDKDGGTLVTLHTRFPTAEALAYVKREHKAEEGGHQTLGRLALFVEEGKDMSGKSLPQFAVFETERVFAAPRDLVWTMHSEAEHLAHWWGPKGCKLEVASLEFRPGGIFHYAMRYSTGADMWGRKLYRAIEPKRRIVWLNSFSNPKGGIARAPFSDLCPLEMENTVTLFEQAGKTRLHLISRPFGATPAEEQFYEELKPSLNQGYGGTLDQLEAYMKKASA